MGLVAVALWLTLPSSASAHAYLIKTVPAASGVLDTPPSTVQLTYDEAVEPRFAIISVTNANGKQETTASVSRSPSDPDTLVVPLRPHLPEGWYLIYWRAISVDGHPVQGAFTYAVGPNPGPAPQFPVPSIDETATSANVLIARWVMFLSVMAAIGLFVLGFFIARPLMSRVPETNLRPLSIAFVIASVIGLIAIPVYLDFSTAIDSLRSVFDVGALVPLFRVTAFGRAYVDMIVCFGLFCIASWVTLWLDRPERRRRPIVALVSLTGGVLAAAAVLAVPGAAGHAGQTSPRGLSLFLDWLHLASGSVWIGGLVGLLVLWFTLSPARRVAGLAVCVPRFSNVALPSVLALLATGIGATIIHMPTVDALWKTGYGQAIIVKIGILTAAIGLASINRLRSKPRLLAARGDPEVGAPATRLLRRTLAGEAFLVAGAVFTAALLSSLAPPPPAFAEQDAAIASVGPGVVARPSTGPATSSRCWCPRTRRRRPTRSRCRITKNGQPVRGADVTLTFNHTEMQMPQQEYQLRDAVRGSTRVPRRRS